MHPSREAHRSACPLHPRETPGQAVSPGRTPTPRRSRSPRPAAAGSGERGVLDQEQHEHDPGHPQGPNQPRTLTVTRRMPVPPCALCGAGSGRICVSSTSRRGWTASEWLTGQAGTLSLARHRDFHLGLAVFDEFATDVDCHLVDGSGEREESFVVGGDRRSGVGAARSGRRRPGSSRRSAPTATHGSAGSAPRPRPPTGAAARPSVRPGGRARRGGGGRSPARPLPSGC